MIHNETIKKLSDSIFQEVLKPDEKPRTGKPFEWRRAFNSVDFTLSNIEMKSIYSVNDVDYFANLVETSEPESSSQIKASVKTITVITAEASSRDSIYLTDETESYAPEPADGLYLVVPPKLQTKIVLSNHQGGPVTTKYFANGVYGGLAFREHDEDRVVIQMELPTQYLDSLVSKITKHPDVQIVVAASIQSFSFEVDDALREWYHPRDLIIHRSAPACVISIVIDQPISHLPAQPALEDDSGSTPEYPSAVPYDSPSNAPAPVLLASISKLTKLAKPLWLIAIVLILHLFK